MVDVIFRYCAVAVIFAASIGIYTVLVSRVLPAVLLSPARGALLGDRGVRKCVFEGGRSVTYEPKLGIRKYISQYVLFEKNGEKYIKCKINEKISSLKYELVLYDRKNKATGVLEIAENMSAEGYTSEVMLPCETSYVHLQLVSVNGTAVKEKENELYRGRDIMAFLVFTSVLTFAEGMFMHSVIHEIYNVFFGYAKYVTDVNVIPAVIAAVVAAVFISVLLLVFNVSAPFKLVWKKSKSGKKRKNRKE